jgi:hypothetical protein
VCRETELRRSCSRRQDSEKTGEQAEGRGGVLRHQEGLRRTRYSNEARQHSKGDDDGINLQLTHQDDGAGQRRRLAVAIWLMYLRNAA